MSDLDPRESDTRDDALAFVTLDGRPVAVCENCNRVTYDCSCCEFCDQPRCVCEPISAREFRAAEARYDGSPARRRRA